MKVLRSKRSAFRRCSIFLKTQWLRLMLRVAVVDEGLGSSLLAHRTGAIELPVDDPVRVGQVTRTHPRPSQFLRHVARGRLSNPLVGREPLIQPKQGVITLVKGPLRTDGIWPQNESEDAGNVGI